MTAITLDINSIFDLTDDQFFELCLKATQEKMREYIANGASLGWLIKRKKRQVEIYRPGRDVDILESPTSLSGEDVLPGFVLRLESIW